MPRNASDCNPRPHGAGSRPPTPARAAQRAAVCQDPYVTPSAPTWCWPPENPYPVFKMRVLSAALGGWGQGCSPVFSAAGGGVGRRLELPPRASVASAAPGTPAPAGLLSSGRGAGGCPSPRGQQVALEGTGSRSETRFSSSSSTHPRPPPRLGPHPCSMRTVRPPSRALAKEESARKHMPDASALTLVTVTPDFRVVPKGQGRPLELRLTKIKNSVSAATFQGLNGHTRLFGYRAGPCVMECFQKVPSHSRSCSLSHGPGTVRNASHMTTQKAEPSAAVLVTLLFVRETLGYF